MEALIEIPTTELIAELVSRCAPAVFIGYKNEGEDGEQVFFNYYKNPVICYGLCHQAAFRIQLDEIKKIHEGEDDE